MSRVSGSYRLVGAVRIAGRPCGCPNYGLAPGRSLGAGISEMRGGCGAGAASRRRRRGAGRGGRRGGGLWHFALAHDCLGVIGALSIRFAEKKISLCLGRAKFRRGI